MQDFCIERVLRDTSITTHMGVTLQRDFERQINMTMYAPIASTLMCMGSYTIKCHVSYMTFFANQKMCRKLLT